MDSGSAETRTRAVADDPVRTTRATYDRVAGDFLERTRDRTRTSHHVDRFAARLTPGALVLDVGAGPGFDSTELRARGLAAISLDLSLGMLRAGAADYPGDRIQGDLRRLPVRSASVAGVWANACLLHLPPDGLKAALRELARVCAPGGSIHLSVKRGTGAGWETERYGQPRWFQYWSAEELDGLLAEVPLQPVGAWQEETTRDSWLVRIVARPR